MLTLHPNCECCDTELPANSTDARICSYECTFCADCVDNVLQNVCPNCGGGFVQRPIRPKNEWRPGHGLKFHPASTTKIEKTFSREEMVAFAITVSKIPPEKR